MTGSDLLVLAPWIVFAVALAAICVLLLRSRHESRARHRRPGRPFSGPAGSASPADREPASCANPQEARCREKNAQARPQ